MKTIIATTAIALSLSAPAFAQVDDVRAFFAQSEDSAIETTVRETSIGDSAAVQAHVLAGEDSALRQNNFQTPSVPARDTGLISFFAQSEDSALEANAK